MKKIHGAIIIYLFIYIYSASTPNVKNSSAHFKVQHEKVIEKFFFTILHTFIIYIYLFIYDIYEFIMIESLPRAPNKLKTFVRFGII